MFKMMEIIGSSQAGFSEAVKDAVLQLLSSGEKVHFFEVVEQRGAVRQGNFKEFQVKLKVAVETTDKTAAVTADKKNFCPTCEQPSGENGHMCVPVHKSDEKCDWCGSLIPDIRHVCDKKVKDLSYVCNSCGRTAVKADNLCSPKKIK